MSIAHLVTQALSMGTTALVCCLYHISSDDCLHVFTDQCVPLSLYVWVEHLFDLFPSIAQSRALGWISFQCRPSVAQTFNKVIAPSHSVWENIAQ